MVGRCGFEITYAARRSAAPASSLQASAVQAAAPRPACEMLRGIVKAAWPAELSAARVIAGAWWLVTVRASGARAGAAAPSLGCAGAAARGCARAPRLGGAHHRAEALMPWRVGPRSRRHEGPASGGVSALARASLAHQEAGEPEGCYREAS